ncbi:hypothetical protein [Sphingobium aromaticivastans]|uniref:hypothetical protein n=1 Tax=Sphingobium aromaticivastans TaxID=1778665 RepID=UPI003017E9DE
MNEAQVEVQAAFKEVVNRNDGSDPKTQRWLCAINAFRAAYARVYPGPLHQLDQGAKRVSDIDSADMLDFLEADPIFYRSGYMKEKLLTELKRRKLDRHEAERLRAIILNVVQKNNHRREFLRYCRAATNVDDERFRVDLKALEQSDDLHTSQRANWVLAALEGKWLDLRQAARGYERRGEFYYIVPNPHIV